MRAVVSSTSAAAAMPKHAEMSHYVRSSDGSYRERSRQCLTVRPSNSLKPDTTFLDGRCQMWHGMFKTL